MEDENRLSQVLKRGSHFVNIDLCVEEGSANAHFMHEPARRGLISWGLTFAALEPSENARVRLALCSRIQGT